MAEIIHKSVSIPVENVILEGELFIPVFPKGIIIFSHGSGSSRFSTRNQMVAQYLQKLNFGTLLFDLLTLEEDKNFRNRFNIDLLTQRLVDVTLWLQKNPQTEGNHLGYFGASTGAASALKAAARLPEIGAIVSRGGRPDLAIHDLQFVKAPTLLIIGSLDTDVIGLNQLAFAEMECEKQIKIVKGASHLFEEAGTMEEVCRLAGMWFGKYLNLVPVYNDSISAR